MIYYIMSNKNELTLLERGMLINNEARKEKIVKPTKNINDMSLLERSLAIENENKKAQKNMMNRKKKFIQQTNNKEKTETKFSSPHDDKFLKLLHYADKYRIPFTRGGIKKTYKNLAEDIHKYEMSNLKKIVSNGLDKKYKEYGHYINLI